MRAKLRASGGETIISCNNISKRSRRCPRKMATLHTIFSSVNSYCSKHRLVHCVFKSIVQLLFLLSSVETLSSELYLYA